MYIPIILGTGREGRQSEKVAGFVLDYVENSELDIETELIDAGDYTITHTKKIQNTESEKIKKLGEKFNEADGFIIVTPEYNHGYPGELKQILDLFYSEYNKKPISFCGVSNGIFGGARAVEQLKLVSIELQMLPMRESLFFPKVQELFDEVGELKEKNYHERAEKFLRQLHWHAEALKKARENNN